MLDCHTGLISPSKKIWKSKRGTYFAPIESIVQIKGLSSSLNPAITGWQKYGPNLKKNKDIHYSLFMKVTIE